MVEHSLGKGEVVSSILTGSTRKPQQNQHLWNRALPFPPRFGPEQIANSPGKLGEIWGTCSADVPNYLVRQSEDQAFDPAASRALLEHLVAERNLSLNTRASYRDTMMLLLPICQQTGWRCHRSYDRGGTDPGSRA